MLARRLAILTLVATLTAASAAAQGHGNSAGKGRKTPKSSETAISNSVGATTGTLAVSGFREFGTWLDDASVLDPKAGWVSLAFGHYDSPGGQQTDFPVADAAVGINSRTQIGATLPYSHYGFPDGQGASGRGDVYLNSKISLVNPVKQHDHRGLALTPVLEILGDPDPVHGGRVFWGIPISGEMRADHVRLYGSTGFFSRGVFFGSGAVELPRVNRVIPTVALTWAHSLSSDVAANATGLSSARVDLTGSAAFTLTPRVAAFGGVGRTISTVDSNASTLMINGGASISFSAPPAPRRH